MHLMRAAQQSFSQLHLLEAAYATRKHRARITCFVVVRLLLLRLRLLPAVAATPLAAAASSVEADSAVEVLAWPEVDTVAAARAVV